jgi:hypothetical protein
MRYEGREYSCASFMHALSSKKKILIETVTSKPTATTYKRVKMVHTAHLLKSEKAKGYHRVITVLTFTLRLIPLNFLPFLLRNALPSPMRIFPFEQNCNLTLTFYYWGTRIVLLYPAEANL